MPYSLVKKWSYFCPAANRFWDLRFFWPRGHKWPRIQKIRPLYFIECHIVWLKKWSYFCPTANSFRDIKFFWPRGHSGLERPHVSIVCEPWGHCGSFDTPSTFLTAFDPEMPPYLVVMYIRIRLESWITWHTGTVPPWQIALFPVSPRSN